MIIYTDADGNTLISASSQDGRVTLVYDCGVRSVIVNEHDGQLFDSERGRLRELVFNAGRIAGIVKERPR